jgi:hypothetical protein
MAADYHAYNNLGAIYSGNSHLERWTKKAIVFSIHTQREQSPPRKARRIEVSRLSAPILGSSLVHSADIDERLARSDATAHRSKN